MAEQAIYLGEMPVMIGGGEFIMEDFSGLSSGVQVYTASDDYLGGSLTNPAVPYPYRMPIRSFVHIKKHAVVGTNTVILSGVTIGEGVAIGANSLVKEDCEPWMIYVGSPARAIRPRPRERILELEAQLRRELYDAQGNYIPKRQREG